jgi:hypothetical protein
MAVLVKAAVPSKCVDGETVMGADMNVLITVMLFADRLSTPTLSGFYSQT